MSENTALPAIMAMDVPVDPVQSGYPEPYYSQMAGRRRRRLGKAVGITRYGVNLCELAPGAKSALLHAHHLQQEFVYVLSGTPTLIQLDAAGNRTEQVLGPGMCAGFPEQGAAHHLVNRTDQPVTFLEIGDRLKPERVDYPDDDLAGADDANGKWGYTRKDGSPC